MYVSFYEKIAALRAEKEAVAAGVAARLAADFEVVWPGMVDSLETAHKAAERFRAERVDAVVVVPLIATFGALGWAVLERLETPVVIWNIQPAYAIPDPYGIAELIRNSGSLGTQALGNTLARFERFYRTCFSVDDASIPRRLTNMLRAASAAADVRTATFGRIGSVFPQMTDVQMNAGEWTARIGSRVVDVPPSELAHAYRNQPEDAVSTRADDIAAAHRCQELSTDELSRSARLSLALDDIVEHHGLDGGAFNCHGENCLQNAEIGVTACYAVSRQTTDGRPFSCTGDLPTAIALFLLKRLSGTAIYGELDFIDPVANVVVIANGGEGDFAAADGPVEIAGNENFAGLHGRGASPKMRVRPGAATLLSFTPLDVSGEYRMVVGAGEITDIPVRGLKVFHQAFRFDGVPAERGFEQWCDAGAVHHLALASGDQIEPLRLTAQMLNFDFQQVGGTHRAVEG